ncbi:MAG: substrate-binding domain-containing protein [Actinomycetota bacterium]|nr:substrate-binding domain-containing protein [Actinomycetota bacterium]
MGRHSLPDPDEPSEQSEEPPTERFGFDADSTGAGESDSGGAGDRDEPTGVEGERRDSIYEAGDHGDEFGYLAAPPAQTPPPPPPPRGGRPQHGGDWEGGEWTGSHRAVTPARRSVSIGVIVALVSVVVAVGAVIAWRFFGDALSDRSNVAAARCVEGEVSVSVVADPAIAEPVTTLAQRYNENADPVGDRCVNVTVLPADSDQVLNGFTGEWSPDLGKRPALWIPASSVSADRLEAATGAQTVSDSRSLVTSPVVLAVPPALQAVLGDQNWGTLPGLQTDPAGLDKLGLLGWGGLRLAMPLSQDSDASYLAAEAVAAATAPPGAPATAGLGAVSTLLAAGPDLGDTDAATALDAMLDVPDPSAAPVHAVVTTEQRLFQRSTDLPDASSELASWLPPGPTAIADFPTVLLDGDWLSEEQVTGASEFARFLRKPEQLADFAGAGFRVEGTDPPASDVVDFGPLSEPLNVGDGALRASIADTLAAPAQSPTVTIMLDQSMSADEGGQSRLGNVVDALTARLQALPPDSAVGLWTFDGVAGRSEVSTGPLAEPVDGRPRSEVLTADLEAQTASDGGAVSFTTLRLVYTEASANFREGQPNSVLVITAGPHTDQTLGGEGLQQYISGAFDPARPVAVNVIDFGDDSDRGTWEAVTQTTGGSYVNLATSDAPELTATITDMLS